MLLSALSLVTTAAALVDGTASGTSAHAAPALFEPVGIFARDGSAAEPISGTSPLVFAVTLSAPADSSGVSVSYATADGGSNPATGGSSCGGGVDYVAASGTLNFAAGEQVKAVPVNVCADSSTETDETLLLNLSSASGGVILDAQAVGTVRQTNTAGTLIISELRAGGPDGATDEFVELYNNTDSQLTVAASDASGGYGVFVMDADCNATPVLVGTVPNGTAIPARGHFLLAGSAYSLSSYATGDASLLSDIENNHNVAVFSTADVTNLSTVTRLDAAGYGSNTGGVCDLLREGNTLPAILPFFIEYSFFRKQCDYQTLVGCQASGDPKDTNDNASDFLFVDTNATDAGAGQHLGAPGPENLGSPIRRDNAGVLVLALDGTKAQAAAPNRVRDFTSAPSATSTLGTLSVRRRIENNTGANVTRIRFRVIEITTYPSPGLGTADFRPISSTAVLVTGVADVSTCTASTGSSTTPCTVTVQGTTLEQPPSQPNGGGYNSTLAAGTVSTGAPLAPGASINVQWMLGVQAGGSFRFFITIEALP